MTDESSRKSHLEARVITVHGYSNIVYGSDDQTYYCDTDHTSVANASDGDPPTDDGNGNWTPFSTDKYGVDWEAGRAYKYDETGKLILHNDLTNEAGDSGYIEYIGYVQAGFADVPTEYDPHFIEAFTTLLASMAASAAQAKDVEPDYEQPVESWLDARN
jgi:hypothetical protein